jgi:biofilm PGA synthesis N-glycosyltransferase PgaC
VKVGGIDHIAVITARMKGWKTRTFAEKVVHHHREIGTAQQTPMMAKFKTGFQDYALGSHPLWELSRMIYQARKRPFVVGGTVLMAGYLWAMVQRAERPVSRELVAFRRREQMQRLKKYLTGGRASTRSHLEASSRG